MTPLKICGWFFVFLLELLIIYYLNPIYILVSDRIYYGSLKVINLIFSKTDIKAYLKVIIEIVTFFNYLIYLEIIELKFLGLDKNLKISIIKRGNSEIEENDDDDYDDESHDEEEENDDNNMDDENNNNNDNVELKLKEWVFNTMKKLKITKNKNKSIIKKIIYIYLEKY